MKKRVISLLAILAMLCTMFVFAMPTTLAATEEDYASYPKYADHANYGADQKNWTIRDAADWLAMWDTAKAAAEGSVYFDGHTFHLTNDVDLSSTAWMVPMGNKNYFGGTINGHGFGLDNLKIHEQAGLSTTGETVTGLFYRLGNCTFIDFGVNSGIINRRNDNALSCTTTFGGLVDGYTPTFTRVWSGAHLYHNSSGMVSGLASSALGTYSNDITVNGYVFDGLLSVYNKHCFSMIGYQETDRSLSGDFTYTNIITDAQLYNNGKSQVVPKKDGATSYDADATFTPTNTVYVADGSASSRYSMIFASRSTAQIGSSTFENIYTVEYNNVRAYYGRVDGNNPVRTGDPTMMTESALEAAWKVNQNPSTKAEPVYFTLVNGKIRPTADASKMIVKVTLTGDREEVFYLNANETYALAKTFGKNDKQTFKIGDTELTELALGKSDVTIDVSIACDHANATYKAKENAHIKACADCGYNKEIPCSAQSYTIDAYGTEQLEAGKKATHSGTCQFCGGAFVLECDVTYVSSTEANKEAYWDYSSCVCGRANVEHKDSAKIMSGDTNGDSAVDLLDAVQMLRTMVQLGSVDKSRNADVDDNGVLNGSDVVLAIKIWFGNPQAKKIAGETEKRVNEGNLFNASDVIYANLTVNGELGDVEGYVVSDPIEVKEGEKLSFGPVRLSAPVIGYFFDAEGNPLQLIDHTNVKVEYTFDGGKALVSITAPEGAKSIRFQMAEEEAAQFYFRVNTAITGMDYEQRFDTTVENALKGRTLLTVGDSLCAAANDAYVGNDVIGYLKGWARRIRDTFGAKVTNSSKGGSSISIAAPIGEGESAGSSSLYIYNQLNQHSGSKNFDYILLEGGVNDHRLNERYNRGYSSSAVQTPLGTFKADSYNPADFDSEDTVAGGMERLIYTAIKEHGDTAAIGYIALYEMSTSTSGFENAEAFLNTTMAICEKWGIEYIDFYHNPPEGFDPNNTAHTSDHCHANTDGYDLMQPGINELCLRMRPVSQEIYNAVRETKGIEATANGAPLNSIEENPYKDSLKILAIGNSFSQDATQYLWSIADSYGVEDVFVGNMKIGGCPLDLVYEHITNNAAEFQFQTWTTENGGVYKATSNVSIETALKAEDWDIITIQQASDQNLVFDENGNEVDTYSKVDEILEYLQDKEPDAKILWHMTWAYPKESTKEAFAAYGNNQLTMYHSLLDRAQELTGKYEALEGVLPVGTAIQNLRDRLLPLGITEIAETGVGINRDGFHLNEGIGRYTAALTWYCYLTGSDPRAAMALPANAFGADVAKYRDEIAASVLEAIQNPYDYRTVTE